jgi:molybdenum cofactor biosynthesis protein B
MADGRDADAHGGNGPGDEDHDADGDHAHGHRDHDADGDHAHGHRDHDADGVDHHGHGDDHHAHDVEDLGVAVVTVSSTRDVEDDPAGDAVAAALEAAGHTVETRAGVDDDYDAIQRVVNDAVDDAGVDCVVTTGGTGVTPDDVTTEAVEALLDKRLPGFGELFRQRSYEEIGTRAMGSRATAGVVHGVVAFSLPGSEAAARLGAEELIVPEAPHLAGLARRGDGG